MSRMHQTIGLENTLASQHYIEVPQAANTEAREVGKTRAIYRTGSTSARLPVLGDRDYTK
jgi:hypothetical protein